MALLVGDSTKDAFKRSGAIASSSSGRLVLKRECICGKRVFCTKVRFFNSGAAHDLRIEHDHPSCVEDSRLVIRVDSRTVVRVRHLRWKFRGNEMFLVDGIPVEVSWDAYDWLFGPSLGGGNVAIFMFRASFPNERMRASPSPRLSPDRSRCGSPDGDGSKGLELGFSLVLYASKNERMNDTKGRDF
ncbi:uncharacterized protein LOC127250205 [Andrographis paniculata]|uniref:uncharacterized protein LOC127250205 n=1 Tax=Andrographis paniculata TaxID=175694 RepID=UPI0021E87527|nr:uncharacterized protein LOC127250205 [Andrographis paniculata]